MELTRDAVEFSAAPAAGGAAHDHHHAIPLARTGRAATASAQLLHAEWTKFRTVRGWVIGMIVAILVTAGIGLFLVAASGNVSCQA